MHSYRASEIFEIKFVDNSCYPLNIDFNILESNESHIFCSPGIFTLHYKGELIYIGYTESNNDVRTTRWIRQIATITLRGKGISFSDNANKSLIENNKLKYFFRHEIIKIDNNDFQTSQNRVLFAAEHWNEFAVLSQNTLSHFIFNWYPNLSTKPIIDLENLCNTLKMQYKPRCNREYEFFTL